MTTKNSTQKIIAFLFTGLLTGFFLKPSAAQNPPSPQNLAEAPMAFTLKSSAFSEGQRIPVPHTCMGADLSPPLSWSGAPAGTQEFALVCDDPDAPMRTWVHWVLYKIPGKRTDLPQGIFKGDTVKDIGMQGRSDFGSNGYGGPCPPPGKDHRYFFKLYALSKPLEAEPGMTKDQLLSAMKGRILGQAQLMGVFSR